MQPYVIDVSAIVDDLGEQIALDERIPLDVIEIGDNTFTPVSPLLVTGVLTNAGDGIALNGSLEATLRATCSRCLEPFDLVVTSDLDILYTTEAEAAQLPEDTDWEPLGADNTVDLVPAAESTLRLELPFAPIHAEECAGICPLCGCNLNEQTCSCDSDQPQPGPFDVLKGLLSDAETEAHPDSDDT